jgi:hypothetical protein
MRPSTLSEAVSRIDSGQPAAKVWAEVLDTFYTASSPEARLAVLVDAPPITGDKKLDALAAAIAEYLAKLYRLGAVPSWVKDSRRILDEPWFTTPSSDPALREYLAYASPAEFRSRNIFTEERPLRRASSAGHTVL